MFTFFIGKRSKTTIIVFKVIALTSLINIIIFMLSLKKCDRSSKTTKNAPTSKKKDRLFKIKFITNNKKDNNVKTLS